MSSQFANLLRYQMVKLNNRKHLSAFLACAGLVLALGFLVLAASAQQTKGATGQGDRIDYNWQVRPILSDNCFRCHGPDAKSRQAGLRLDQKDSAYAQALIPGKPEQSELVNRITSTDPS